MTRLLSWIEFDAFMQKIAVTICSRCDACAIDCGVLTGENDENPS